MSQTVESTVRLRGMAPVRRKRLSALAKQEERWAYLLLLPSILGLVLFTAGPTLQSLGISFTKYDVVRPPQWVGLDNYIQLFTKDRVFGIALKNTCLYVLGTTPFGISLSLLLAIAMNQRIKGVSFFRSIFFLPTISSGVAVALLWTWIYNPSFGVLNWLLGLVGVPQEMQPAWLTSTRWALPALMIMAIWQGLGYNMTIFLAGLQGIDPSYYEAAEIDGAGSWAKFWRITLPLISPTTFFLLVMAGIGGLQVFVSAFVMTAGGPRYATTTLALHLFYTAFRYMRMGQASAMAYVVFAMVFALTYMQLRLQKRWVHYE
ncbi:MAG: carbohydrate ABC transporter permease [Anaerolineae bacterium]